MAGEVSRAAKKQRMNLGSLDLSSVSSDSSKVSTPAAQAGETTTPKVKLMLPSILGDNDEMDGAAIQVLHESKPAPVVAAVAAPTKGGIAARRGKTLELGVAAAVAGGAGASQSFNIQAFQGTIRSLDDERINAIANLNLEDLEFVCALGEGAQGAVDKVLHKPTGAFLARKRIRLDTASSEEADKKRQELYTEIKTYAQSSCPFVVRSFACALNEDVVTIILELMDRGSLEGLIRSHGPLPEWVIREIGFQMCLALKYLHHDRHLVHRDLKPANVLMNADGMVKLTDFGVSKEVASTLANAHTFVGTFAYMSPERIDSSRSVDGGYSFSSDVWAFGLILVECALGAYPYPKDVVAMPFLYMQTVCEKPPPIDTWLPSSRWTEDFRSFVALCMHSDPTRREPAPALLEHPFLRGRPESSPQDFAVWLAAPHA